MKRVIYNRTLSLVLVICFSISSVSSCPVSTCSFVASMLNSILSQDSGTPVSADAELFDEERGEEERSEDFGDDKADRFQTNLFFICLITDPARVAISESQQHFFFNAPKSGVTDIPRYLSQRTLLI